MELKIQLENLIKETLEQKGWEVPNFLIETPKSQDHGDFASNVAMMLARSLKKNPRMIAEELKNSIKSKFISKVEIAGPGFLNFFLKTDALNDILFKVVSEGSNFCKNIAENSDNINLEFVSANPTGKLHIGHSRNASVGDSLSNILKHYGHKVTNEYYINDAGAQINKLGMSVLIRYKNLLGIELELPTDAYHGQEIIDVAQELHLKVGAKYKHTNYSEVDGIITDRDEGIEIEDFAKAKMLDQIKTTMNNMGVKFEIYTPESYFHKNNLIEECLKRIDDYTYIQDGALWIASTKAGDEKDRVIKKSNGYYSYLAPDIAYHANKLDRGFNRLINIWGSDHHGYIPRLGAAIQFLGLPREKFEVLIMQMVKLIKDGEEFKMSKRTGNSLTSDQLLEWIGKDALRYYMVANSCNSHLEIDIDIAKKQSSENPVFYIQYAHARICQLLKKYGKTPNPSNLTHLNGEKEKEIINHINKFKDVLTLSAEKLEPHRIALYSLQLAKLFHSFYNNSKVFIEDKDLEEQRLFLALAVKKMIKLTLGMLGVSSPEIM